MTERPHRILNLNDEQIPRYVNQQLLEQGGYEVVSVASGEQALELLRLGSFDMVALDVQLGPGVPDGFELCRTIKADPKCDGLIVLLISASFVSTANRVHGLDSGADGYLVQPFEAAELHATLRSLLRTRAAEREATALNEMLQTALARRDEFLAMLGHELRNPLSAIRTSVNLLGRDDAAVPRDRVLEVLDRQTCNLTRIVDDLLDMARITNGKISLDSVRVDLRDVVSRARDSFAPEVAQAEHTLTVHLPDEPLEIQGDPARLEQVVANLLVNAIKYTTRGDLTVSLSRIEPGRARLEVADTGIGMDSETLARVFDVFTQAEQALDRSAGGLGLGLPVVRQLVELHHGDVYASSPGPGQGSTFVVELPVAAPSDAAAPAPPAEAGVRLPSPSNGHLHLLIVEDHHDSRVMLAESLRAFGYEVSTATDGRTGLHAALTQRPDAVLLDIGLPGKNGYEVAEAIRRDLGDGCPLLIALTGYGQESDREAAMRAGFDAHLVKPIRLEQLDELLEGLPPLA